MSRPPRETRREHRGLGRLRWASRFALARPVLVVGFLASGLGAGAVYRALVTRGVGPLLARRLGAGVLLAVVVWTVACRTVGVAERDWRADPRAHLRPTLAAVRCVCCVAGLVCGAVGAVAAGVLTVGGPTAALLVGVVLSLSAGAATALAVPAIAVDDLHALDGLARSWSVTRRRAGEVVPLTLGVAGCLGVFQAVVLAVPAAVRVVAMGGWGVLAGLGCLSLARVYVAATG